MAATGIILKNVGIKYFFLGITYLPLKNTLSYDLGILMIYVISSKSRKQYEQRYNKNVSS